MKINKKILAFGLITSCLLLLLNCGGAAPTLQGKWIYISGATVTTLEFMADGRYQTSNVFAGQESLAQEGTWSLNQAGIVAISMDNGELVYTNRFRIEKNLLYLQQLDASGEADGPEFQMEPYSSERIAALASNADEGTMDINTLR